MNAAAKLGVYAAGLAVVFGGALGLGSLAGPAEPPAKQPAETTHGHSAPAEKTETKAAAAKNDTPGGLQVSQDGYTLTPVTTTVKPDAETDFRFTVTAPDGRPLTDYEVSHEKKLHFIVVSRDLGDFLHLHPVEAGNGEWSVKLNLPRPGAYRAFADFAPAGHKGLTLGVDLHAPGDYQPRPLPPAGITSEVDGYTVTLDGDLAPGKPARFTLSVAKDGKPVTDLEPYLGAFGHLVALRNGDLAYLHVHPDESAKPGPDITFHTEVPSAGDYRLFLDFKHEGEVRTADFTAQVVGAATPMTPQAESEAPGHEH
ncbi:hypothetical protein [Spongiactinospora sp. TRM90649]|uniref:hypothetical protein n=1 Tax=Spongiactinospora sp. TRM90649 TaxID=3031114 RepID=UPI0023F818A0|nr:hypothetical protein [Spongiactinospora sp. TRM90649]MDF5752475.1 hypothetical protein [Spongiactinospora sp. TRM90649]